MTDDEKRGIEAQLALKERALALNEQEHGLAVKRRRLTGATAGCAIVFALCMCAVFIGGNGIGGYGGDSFIRWCVTNQNVRADSPSARTADLLTLSMVNQYASKPMLQPHNWDTATTSNSTAIALNNGKLADSYPPPYLPITALILKGLVILAGLGAAAYTVRVIVNANND